MHQNGGPIEKILIWGLWDNFFLSEKVGPGCTFSSSLESSRKACAISFLVWSPGRDERDLATLLPAGRVLAMRDDADLVLTCVCVCVSVRFGFYPVVASRLVPSPRHPPRAVAVVLFSSLHDAQDRRPRRLRNVPDLRLGSPPSESPSLPFVVSNCGSHTMRARSCSVNRRSREIYFVLLLDQYSRL